MEWRLASLQNLWRCFRQIQVQLEWCEKEMGSAHFSHCVWDFQAWITQCGLVCARRWWYFLLPPKFGEGFVEVWSYSDALYWQFLWDSFPEYYALLLQHGFRWWRVCYQFPLGSSSCSDARWVQFQVPNKPPHLTILPKSILSVYKVRNFCEALPGFKGLEEDRSPSLGPKTQEELHKSSFICFPQALLWFEGQAEGTEAWDWGRKSKTSLFWKKEPNKNSFKGSSWGVQLKAESQVWGQRLKKSLRKSLRKSLTKGPSKPLPEALLGFEGQPEGKSLRLGSKTQEEPQ